MAGGVESEACVSYFWWVALAAGTRGGGDRGTYKINWRCGLGAQHAAPLHIWGGVVATRRGDTSSRGESHGYGMSVETLERSSW